MKSDAAADGDGRGVLQALFGVVLVARLLYPFFNPPTSHLFSDPLRHWDNGARFLDPGIMGSSDPYLYQLWMYVWRSLGQDSAPAMSLAAGLLCAAMPLGWYRTLRSLQSRERALVGASLIGMIPESVGLYGYFMNETLLLSLLGFCFWATLRAHRKRTVAAFGGAVILWLCAAFTRTVAVPMAAGCLGVLWLMQPAKLPKAWVASVLALVFAIPAGLHARAQLHYFAPFGNLYLNQIYSVSGRREIDVSYGPQGNYHFGCPSFFNPTFYPFSDWTTARAGTVSVVVDLTQGRAGWLRERTRVSGARTFPAWRERVEGLAFTLFGQSWPNSDRSTGVGWLTVWTRWLWAPLVVGVTVAVAQRRYAPTALLVPVCALGTLLILLVQSQAVMEARYREPVDALLVAAALLAGPRRRPVPGDRRAA